MAEEKKKTGDEKVIPPVQDSVTEKGAPADETSVVHARRPLAE